MQLPERTARKLRVLRISHSSNVPSYRARERALLANHPVELELIVPKQWQHLGGTNEQAEQFTVIKSGTIGTGSIPLFAYDPRVICRAIEKFKPDILDVHEEPYSVSCFETFFLALRFAHPPALVFYSAQNIKKSYPPPFSWTEQFVYRNASGAYPCSEEVKTVLQSKGFVRNNEVIPLGVDSSLFRPLTVARADVNIPRTAFVIGYFGRLEYYKGVHTILEALAADSSSSRAHLLVIGVGSYATALKDQAEQLGLSDFVHWLGEVDSLSVPKYLAYCDITIVPSMTTPTWKEQFGRAVTESMACGVPVIASDSGSLPEVIAEAGLLFREGDANDLSHQIEKLRNKTLRAELSERGLSRVQSLYTWDKVAAATYAFYEKALELVKRSVSAY